MNQNVHTFTVLQYYHDAVSRERFNVGVALLAPAAAFFDIKLISRYHRISRAFPNLDGAAFLRTLNPIAHELRQLWKTTSGGLGFERVEGVRQLTDRVLVPDDSALQFSEQGVGFADDPEEALSGLFERYVERHWNTPATVGRDDKDVWRLFRGKFEAQEILSHLKKRTVRGQYYAHEFEHTWNNGILNIEEAE